MTWGIKWDWRFEPVEIVKETEKTVFYIDHRWGRGRETRTDKSKMLDWRGSEAGAHAVAAKLTSARAEYDRRVDAARTWYKAREAEILASRIEARSAETPQEVRPEGREPDPKGDAPNQSVNGQSNTEDME